MQGLHPIHGHTDSQTKERIEMLPNNVSLSSFKNFKLLLGPNYSGKSTLLAQVGLLCLMAQAGLFVPAKQMLFHPFGNILTHLTGNKDLYSTSSSMMLEAQVWQQNILVDLAGDFPSNRTAQLSCSNQGQASRRC